MDRKEKRRIDNKDKKREEDINRIYRNLHNEMDEIFNVASHVGAFPEIDVIEKQLKSLAFKMYCHKHKIMNV